VNARKCERDFGEREKSTVQENKKGEGVKKRRNERKER